MEITADQLKRLRSVAEDLKSVDADRTGAPRASRAWLNALGSDILRVLDEIRGTEVYDRLKHTYGWSD